MQTDKRAVGSLCRRVQQIVQLPLDGTTVRDALQALSQSYEDSDAHTIDTTSGLNSLARHRDLRAEMQSRQQHLDTEFVSALSQVDAAFTKVESSVAALDSECRELRILVDSAQHATAGISSQAGLLSEERQELIARQKLAYTFATRFSLTEREKHVLGCNDNMQSLVDGEYFAALDRVAAARSECQKLLSVRKHTAANDLLSELARQEEQAFAGLLRWTLSAIRALTKETAEAAVSRELRRALQKLIPHQALFDVAMSELGRIRAETVAHAFLNALVRGGPRGIPRPIETHAADPLRYVGDMLAWVHQACASERELLESLLVDSGFEARLIAEALSGVARPLEIRLRQTLAAIENPVAVYAIDSLLVFYARLLAVACGASNSEDVPPLICSTIADLARESRALLLRQLDVMTEAAIGQLDAAAMSPALRVPDTLHALLATVAEIWRQYEASHSNEDDVVDNKLGLQSVTNSIVANLEKILSEAHTVIEKSPNLREYEQTMLMLNIHWAIQQEVAVAGIYRIERSAEPASSSEQKLADKLAQQLLAIVKQKTPLPFDIEEIKQMGISTLRECVESFNQNLRTTSPDLDVARLVSRLDNHVLARTLAVKVAQLLVEDYAVIYQHIIDNNVGNELNIMLSPDTVSTLL